MSRRKRKRRSQKSITSLSTLFVLVVVAIIYLISNPVSENKTQLTSKVSGDTLAVHYLDVGQGDSIFVELPNDECMLIDASTSEYGDDIVETISNLGYTTVDYLVATHPHADHIGGMTEVVENFDIGEVYMPRATTSTNVYENLLQAISDKGLQINTAKAGKAITTQSEVEMEFVAPVSDDYSDLNNYSAVLKISYGSSSFLFTGDAEDVSESEMLSHSYSDLNVDVLKVGHHGSRYSSTTNFLDAVSPKYAIISCGADNSYGHPHDEALTRLQEAGAQVYRTDKQGTITITTTGDGNYEVDY